MKVGDIDVLPVFDGFGYEVARDVLLNQAEADPWSRHQAQLDAHGRLKFTIGGFLIRTGDRTILVDAGAGTIDTGQYKGGQLLTSLQSHGVTPGDVTDVIFTHLHFDHVGWATSKGEVVFRNAIYRVHEADWAYFVESPGAAPGAVRKLSPVKAQLETFATQCVLAPGLEARPGARAHPWLDDLHPVQWHPPGAPARRRSSLHRRADRTGLGVRVRRRPGRRQGRPGADRRGIAGQPGPGGGRALPRPAVRPLGPRQQAGSRQANQSGQDEKTWIFL